jgi:hypothetical protein
MVTFFLIAYLLIGIAHVGTIGVAFLAYYGAHYGWKWEWWQALMLAVPGIILMLAAAVPVCLAIWAQRLGWLISLHHHLAAGDKDGQQST